MSGHFKRAIVLGGLILAMAGLAQAQSPQRPPVAGPPGAGGGSGSAGGAGPEPTPMIFYVAHGPTGACGPNCSEWIAAEGTVQWDTYKRLIAILDRQGGRKLPLVINAWGFADLNVATSLGRILRDHGIDTMVGPTEVSSLQWEIQGGVYRPQASRRVTRRQGDIIARDLRSCLRTHPRRRRSSQPASRDPGCCERQSVRLQPPCAQRLRGTAQEPGDDLHGAVSQVSARHGRRPRAARPRGNSRRGIQIPSSQWLRLRIITDISL